MEKSLFWDAKSVDGAFDRTYNSDDFASMFQGFWGEGVVPNTPNALWVESLENSMTVVVNPGDAFIQGRFYQNTEDLHLTLDIASDKDRVDFITLRCDREARKVFIRILKGADGMGEPTYARTDNYHDLILAKVHVKANAKFITDNDIEDTRGSKLCPWVNLRWTIDNLQQSFQDWYAGVQEVLNKEVALQLQEQVNKNKADLIAANDKILDLQGKLSTANDEISTLKSEVSTTKTNLQAATTELNTAKGKIAALEKKRWIVKKGDKVYVDCVDYNPDIDTSIPK